MDKTREGLATIHQNIRKLLKLRKKPLRCYEIRDLYDVAYGKYYSESGFSARLREMVDVACNLSDYTYSIKKRKKGC